MNQSSTAVEKYTADQKKILGMIFKCFATSITMKFRMGSGNYFFLLDCMDVGVGLWRNKIEQTIELWCQRRFLSKPWATRETNKWVIEKKSSVILTGNTNNQGNIIFWMYHVETQFLVNNCWTSQWKKRKRHRAAKRIN